LQGAVVLDVEDNGAGFDIDGGGSADRHGLRNIKDRARAMGAKLRIDTKPGAGTKLRLELPVERRKATDG
jgi:two-component system sensor histidine kinase DegS